jgi:5-carboxymethyl-2-hydroxymuconate isomerase
MIDYSSNLESEIDMSELCNVMRLAAIETGVFPLAGIRVRAFPSMHVSIADGNEDHGYIDLSVRLRAGREMASKKDATEQIFRVLQSFVAPAMSKRSIALSMEMRDIDPDLSPKAGNTRDHLNG